MDLLEQSLIFMEHFKVGLYCMVPPTIFKHIYIIDNMNIQSILTREVFIGLYLHTKR